MDNFGLCLEICICSYDRQNKYLKIIKKKNKDKMCIILNSFTINVQTRNIKILPKNIKNNKNEKHSI